MQAEKLKAQIEIIRNLLDELEWKLEHSSFWKKSSKPDRIKEAEAIVEASKALVALVKIAKP